MPGLQGAIMGHTVTLNPYGAHPSELNRIGERQAIARAVRAELTPLLPPKWLPESYVRIADDLDSVADSLATKLSTDAFNHYTHAESLAFETVGGKATQGVAGYIALNPGDIKAAENLSDGLTQIWFRAGAIEGYASAFDDVAAKGISTAQVAKSVPWNPTEVKVFQGVRDVFRSAASVIRALPRV